MKRFWTRRGRDGRFRPVTRRASWSERTAVRIEGYLFELAERIEDWAYERDQARLLRRPVRCPACRARACVVTAESATCSRCGYHVLRAEAGRLARLGVS